MHLSYPEILWHVRVRRVGVIVLGFARLPRVASWSREVALAWGGTRGDNKLSRNYLQNSTTFLLILSLRCFAEFLMYYQFPQHLHILLGNKLFSSLNLLSFEIMIFLHFWQSSLSVGFAPLLLLWNHMFGTVVIWSYTSNFETDLCLFLKYALLWQNFTVNPLSTKR